MAEKEYIERGAVLQHKRKMYGADWGGEFWDEAVLCEEIRKIPAADVVEVDKVAEMLRAMFDDDYACNYNGNDEWLPEVCKYGETDCPHPKDRLGCWKEFVKHFLAKMDGERKCANE